MDYVTRILLIFARHRCNNVLYIISVFAFSIFAVSLTRAAVYTGRLLKKTTQRHKHDLAT